MRTLRFLVVAITCSSVTWLAGTGRRWAYAATDDPPAAPSKDQERVDQGRAPDKSENSNLKSQIPSASPETSLAWALLASLSPEHMKQFGQMLEQDWKDRPEWGDMAVAILKSERMRPGMGWWRSSVKRYDWSWLRGHLDKDGDGQIDRTEFPSNLPDADKLFARLDRDLDGHITAADLEPNEPSGPMNMATIPGVMANYLFSRLDRDSNGRVTLEELAEFFSSADSEDLGFLTTEDLRVALDDPDSRKPAPRGSGGGEPPPAEMLRMFLSGQLGWLDSGPEYGDTAPDFTLPTYDGASTVTLSDSRGKRPVVLIFGSFT